jgi:hypothetical protein
MPINRIVATPRGRAAAVGAALFATASGWAAFIASQPDPRIAAIHEAVAKGYTPPAVQLAIDKLIIPWEGLVLRAHWDRFSKRYDICFQ